MQGPVIDIAGLSKFYGKTTGIDRVDLQVTEGDIFGFIGPNGAGKSTTIRILLNLIFPSAGSARILGMDVIRDTKAIKQLTGYIPSDANAYPSMKVIDFLNYCQQFYGISNGKGRMDELAERFDLDMNRRIADLSTGNRKKVSIIQSLLHSPKLLILDEPTTGLDPLIQERFFDLLRLENCKGMTVFFSSHILSEVQSLCKRVAIIREGRIIRVEEIEILRRKQLKKVHAEFEVPFHAKEFTISGMQAPVYGPGNAVSFMYPGNVNDLVNTLIKLKLVNLTIEEPSLEEIFLHYYQQNSTGQ